MREKDDKPSAMNPEPVKPGPMSVDDIVTAYADRIVSDLTRAIEAARPSIERDIRQSIADTRDRINVRRTRYPAELTE